MIEPTMDASHDGGSDRVMPISTPITRCDACTSRPVTTTLGDAALCDPCHQLHLEGLTDRAEFNGVSLTNPAEIPALIDGSVPRPETSNPTTAPDHNGPLAGVDGFHYTDWGNAQRLLAEHGAGLRYVPVWGSWLTYDQGRWSEDHGDTVVSRHAAMIGRTLIKRVPEVHGDSEALKRLVAAIRRAESATGIRATTTVAAKFPGVAVGHAKLDADPLLLNVSNGTVDLRDGTLRAHDPADLLTKVAAVNYDPQATSRLWQDFLNRVLPDDDVRWFVQRLAGLALVGEQLEHILPICLGDGANGKSTLTKVLADVLGDYAVVASRDLLLALKHDTHPTAKAALFGKRFAHSGELPPSAKLDEAQIKELTGGDRITARRMRENPWEFDPTHTLWLHANHRPTIEGTDDGIWRRVLLIPFDVKIPPAERKPGLAGRIVREEGSGVLKWMLDGLADYRASGLRVPQVIAAATSAYRRDSDTVAEFLAASGLSFDPSLRMPAGELKQIHATWFASHDTNKSESGHYKAVLATLKHRGVTDSRTKRERFWDGIGRQPVSSGGRPNAALGDRG